MLTYLKWYPDIHIQMKFEQLYMNDSSHEYGTIQRFVYKMANILSNASKMS